MLPIQHINNLVIFYLLLQTTCYIR